MISINRNWIYIFKLQKKTENLFYFYIPSLWLIDKLHWRSPFVFPHGISASLHHKTVRLPFSKKKGGEVYLTTFHVLELIHNETYQWTRFTWKYIKFNNLLTSGARTSTVFSYISTRLGCSFDFGWGIALEQHLQVYNITACSCPS